MSPGILGGTGTDKTSTGTAATSGANGGVVVGGAVSNSDIRQIKLNYLQMNRR